MLEILLTLNWGYFTGINKLDIYIFFFFVNLGLDSFLNNFTGKWCIYCGEDLRNGTRKNNTMLNLINSSGSQVCNLCQLMIVSQEIVRKVSGRGSQLWNKERTHQTGTLQYLLVFSYIMNLIVRVLLGCWDRGRWQIWSNWAN